MMQRLLFQQARQVVLRSSRVLSSHQRTPPKIIPSHHSCTSRFFSQWYEADENENEPKTALVIGSNGCLGSTICKHLGRQGVSVIGVDLTSKDDADPTLSGFVSLSNSKPGNLTELTTDLYSGASDILNETSSPQCLSAIIVAAGGWQGDTPVAADDPIQGAAEYAAVMDAMQSQNLHPVLAAGYLIPYFMVPSNGRYKICPSGENMILYYAANWIGTHLNSHHCFHYHLVTSSTGCSRSLCCDWGDARLGIDPRNVRLWPGKGWGTSLCFYSRRFHRAFRHHKEQTPTIQSPTSVQSFSGHLKRNRRTPNYHRYPGES